MKKKLLFVTYSLGGGGAEKALVNLLNLIDRSRYDISLQLFENSGINLEYLPEDVKLLCVDGVYPCDETIRSGKYPYLSTVFAVGEGEVIEISDVEIEKYGFVALN